jgi:hypothetical protein
VLVPAPVPTPVQVTSLVAKYDVCFHFFALFRFTLFFCFDCLIVVPECSRADRIGAMFLRYLAFEIDSFAEKGEIWKRKEEKRLNIYRVRKRG